MMQHRPEICMVNKLTTVLDGALKDIGYTGQSNKK